jgi:NADPH-dependent 2,4-dienoyl-CoA reductase/sulfur reductase-like enzyme
MVIVGASLAGLRAAKSAREAGFTGPLTLVGAQRQAPYDRPPLSKAYLAEAAPAEVPTFPDAVGLAERLDVDVRLGTRASWLDPGRKLVGLCSGADEVELAYRTLIIATGAEARTLSVGADLDGVHTLRTVEDANAIRSALAARPRTVIVGAGFIGSEVASSVRARGLPVTVVEALGTPLANAVGDQIGRACAELHRAHGVELRCGVKVTALEDVGGRVSGVVLDDGDTLPAELVVVGVGAAPATEWLRGSGVELHSGDGGVLCDATLRTSVDGVYAAGDVAHVPHPLLDGRPLRVEHWTNASEQGALAARNALDPGAATPYVGVPYFWSDAFGRRIQFVGVPGADEIRVVSDNPEERKLLALYRRRDRVSGCFGIGRAGQVMKFQRLIARSARWTEALALAGQR